MIYLIKAEETNLYKIGYTEGIVENRMKALQTGCPYKLKLAKKIKGGIGLEKMLHEKYKLTRKEGEWFEFRNINPVIEYMDNVENDKLVQGNSVLLDWKCHIIETISGKDKSFRSERGISNLLELAIVNIKLECYNESLRNIVEYLAHLNGRWNNNDYVKNCYIPSKTKENASSNDLFVYENEMLYKTKTKEED
tara:strand:- start:92 stop:673 length:582 start_codon:yes stop_codon:yes gene_type:complete